MGTRRHVHRISATITAAELASNSVDSDELVDGSIDSSHFSANAVDADAMGILTTKGDALVYSSEPARLAVGTDGHAMVANAGATEGVSYGSFSTGGADAVIRENTGIVAATVDPSMGTYGTDMLENRLILGAIYIPHDVTLTGVGWMQYVQGSFTADNENRVGLYTSDGTNITLVASSTDDGDLFQGAVGIQKKAFSSTYAASAGTYWIAVMVNWSAQTTEPQMIHATNVLHNDLAQPDMTNSNEKLFVSDSGHNTLPSSTAWTGLNATVSRPFMFVY